ncbi:demethylase [Bacteroides congonensis]|uniref:demethylase n=1 Tax=Bacteroides congonensis TaxID=1871006 RepID=UPI001F444253|nr:demethylase [Bacteroides congonensis]
METKKSMILSEIKRNIMENEEYLCINCAKKIECYGPDIKLEEPDLCIPISCIDYQDIEEKFN